MATSVGTCGICSTPLTGEVFYWIINDDQYPLCSSCNDRIESERSDALLAGHDASTLPRAVPQSSAAKSKASDFSIEEGDRPKYAEPLAPTMKLPDPDSLRPLEPIEPVREYVPSDRMFKKPEPKVGGGALVVPLILLAILVAGVVSCIVFLMTHR